MREKPAARARGERREPNLAPSLGADRRFQPRRRASIRRLGSVGIILLVAVSWARGGAPRGKDVMQPVDTSPGSITDARHELTLDLNREISSGVSDLPATVAFNQLNAIVHIEFGFAKEVDVHKPVTYSVSGSVREALFQLGVALKARYEVVGPMQMRVVPATTAPPRKRPTEPPPVKHQ